MGGAPYIPRVTPMVPTFMSDTHQSVPSMSLFGFLFVCMSLVAMEALWYLRNLNQSSGTARALVRRYLSAKCYVYHTHPMLAVFPVRCIISLLFKYHMMAGNHTMEASYIS